MPSLRVHDHGRVGNVIEHRAANAPPFVAFAAEVMTVTAENPHHVMRLPARDHVAREENQLVLGQKCAGVLFGAAAADGPEQHGDVQQPGLVHRVSLLIKAAEELGIYRNLFLPGEREIALQITAR